MVVPHSTTHWPSLRRRPNRAHKVLHSLTGALSAQTMLGADDHRYDEAANDDWESAIKGDEKQVVELLRGKQMVVSDDASDDKTKYTAWDLVARKDNDKVHRDAINTFLQEIEKHIQSKVPGYVASCWERLRPVGIPTRFLLYH